MIHHETNEKLSGTEKPALFSSDNHGITYFDKLDMSLEVSNINVKNNPIQGNYYYSRYGHSAVLVSEKSVNSGKSRDVTKIGWLKLDQENIVYDRAAVYEGFHAQVSQCSSSNLTTSFVGTSPTTPQTVQSKFTNSIISATLSGNGKVVVKPRQASLDIQMTQRKSTDFVVFSDVMTKLTNFTATLVTDKNSNRYLDLVFTNTTGLLVGHLSTHNHSETFRVFVSSSQPIQHSVVSKCLENMTTICFETVWHNTVVCARTVCKTAQLENTDHVDDRIAYTRGEKDSLADPQTWLKYANPLEWMSDGVGSVTEGFIMVVAIIGTVVFFSFLICVVRCICCFYKCCSCCKLSKKRKQNRNRLYSDEDVFDQTNI